jgi:hypothetical protein
MSTTSSHSFAGPRLRQPKPDRDSEAAQVAAQLLRAKLAYVLARVGQVFNGVHANIALLQVRGHIPATAGGPSSPQLREI